MGKCMEMFGVQPANDFSLLQDLYCSDTYWGQPMFPCTDVWKTAYHPLKTKEAYTKCLHEAGTTDTSALEHIPVGDAAHAALPAVPAVGGHESVQGTADSSGKVKRWKQCGGTGWGGGTECESPFQCLGNKWFRMCDDKLHTNEEHKDSEPDV